VNASLFFKGRAKLLHGRGQVGSGRDFYFLLCACAAHDEQQNQYAS
jgi:hypothetical protein